MSLLVAEGLVKRYGRTLAVDGASLAIAPGEVLGLVGESGCGKSTLARLAARLLDPDAGSIRFDGRDATRPDRAMRSAIQMVFQDPWASLNPRSTVARTLEDPLRVNGIGAPAEWPGAVAALMMQVDLSPDLAGRYPDELSGGQRQRVAIARALAPRPRLLICDEPVSSLDTSTRTQIVRLLARLRAETGLAMLFVSHDLAVVRHLSDRIAIMQAGRIVEQGDTAGIWAAPRHDYTRMLLAARPGAKLSIHRSGVMP